MSRELVESRREELVCSDLACEVRSMMAYSRGKVWRGSKTRDVHEIWDVCSDDSVQFLCLHFVREGEVFAHILALESRQQSNGRRVLTFQGVSGWFTIFVDRFHKCDWAEQLLNRKNAHQ